MKSTITYDEWLRETNHSEIVEGDDWITVRELSVKTKRSVGSIQRDLKKLNDQGRLLVGTKLVPNNRGGVPQPIPCYKILAEPKTAKKK